MCDSLEEHIICINKLKIFLDKYSEIIKNNKKKFQSNLFIENYYLSNIAIENLNDRLLEILSKKDCNYDESIKKEIKEYENIDRNIKEIMPILIFYFMSKNNPIVSPEVPLDL